jgi:hypothetical protein
LSQTKTIRKLTQLSKTFMFTPKANSKQKCVKRHKNAKIEVLTALKRRHKKAVTHEGLPCWAQALASCAQAWAGSSQWPAQQLCAILVFPRFYRFVRKNLTVTPIPIPFSPTRSIQQILSYFTEKTYFQISKTAYLRITYFPKTLKITFSQNLNFHPKLVLIIVLWKF